jgi:hypothetical protein
MKIPSLYYSWRQDILDINERLPVKRGPDKDKRIMTAAEKISGRIHEK